MDFKVQTSCDRNNYMCENDGKMWVEGAFTQFHIIKPQSLYKDLELNDLDRSMVLDRTLWRKLIHVVDPT